MSRGSEAPSSIPFSKSFESQCLRLNYWDWGNEQGRPLVLLHGSRDHARSWDWIARALAPSWHVMALDLRGHGDSDWSAEGNYSLTAYLYDLVEFIDRVATEPVTIVSHSLGAALALRYAAVWPERVRSLVAIEGNNFILPGAKVKEYPPLDAALRTAVETWRKVSRQEHRRYPSLDEAVARMRSDHPWLRQGIIDHLARYGSVRNSDGSYSWKFDPCVNHHGTTDFAMPELDRLWRAMDFPIFLPWGRSSGVEDPDLNGFTRLFKNARSAAFDAGHWPHHECQDDFIRELLTFLDDADRSRRSVKDRAESIS